MLEFLLALRISLSVQKRYETITWTGLASKHKIAQKIARKLLRLNMRLDFARNMG